MPINYFNENPPSSGVDIDEVLEEIEYQLIGNKVSKLSYPSGGKVLVSIVDGDMQESEVTPSVITNKASKISSPKREKLVLSKADGEVKESAFTVEDIANNIPKIAYPKDLSTWADTNDGYIIESDGAGGIREGLMSQKRFMARMFRDHISKIPSAAGDRMVLSKADGEVKESA